MYLTISVTSATSERTLHFLPSEGWRTSKKQRSKVAWTIAYWCISSQIDCGHTRHCEDCLCQRKTQRVFWKVWVWVFEWLSGRSAPIPPLKTFRRLCVLFIRNQLAFTVRKFGSLPNLQSVSEWTENIERLWKILKVMDQKTLVKRGSGRSHQGRITVFISPIFRSWSHLSEEASKRKFLKPKEERRRREKINSCPLSFYNSYFGAKKNCRTRN